MLLMKAAAFSRVVAEELGCGVVAGGVLWSGVPGSAGVVSIEAGDVLTSGVVASDTGSHGHGRARCEHVRKRWGGAATAHGIPED